MGSIKKSAGVKARKATFTVTGVGADRIFTPVNKRAKTVARKAGKRTKVTVSDLRKLKGTGTYRYYQYVGTDLKAIRV